MAIDTASAPRILILRRDNIGDLVCTTPLIDALRTQLPKAWIGALVNTYNAEVLSGNRSLNEVFAYEKLKHRSGGLLSHFRTRLAQMSALRGQNIDCILVPSPSPQSLKLARSLKPARVVAAASVAPTRLHEVERCFAVGKAFGVSGKPGPLRVTADAEKAAELQRTLGSGPFVAVHISARRPAQRWPLERYAELVKRLVRQTKVLLLWAPGAKDNPRHPGDDEAATKIAQLAKSDSLLHVPTPDLKTLIAALSLADRVICPDGGAMHLAAALGKPVVALFGDSPVARWYPWGVAHRIVQPESHDLADLPLAPVVDAYEALA